MLLSLALPTLAAEPIAHVGSFPITNSLVNTLLLSIVFLGAAFMLRTRRALVPHGIQNVAEGMIEFMLGYAEQVTGDKERARRFLPIAGTLFLFILLSNWMGILPGIGSIGIWELHHGEQLFIPLFRPAMSDLNTTLALAVFGIAATHVFGIVAIGVFKHLNKFFQFGTIIRGLKKGGIDIFVGFVEFGIGIIETVGEIAKMISLSLRLFGNIFAGEVLLTVIGSLIAFFAPLPFLGLELLVGFVQATVFAMLILVFMTVMTEPAHSH